MAYIYIGNATFPSNTYYLKAAKPLDAKYNVDYINDLWTSIPKCLYDPDLRVDHIAEGQLIYITKGEKWNDIETSNHKGEVWILVNKENIKSPLFDFVDGKEINLKVENPGWRKLSGDTKVNLTWENL